MVIKTHIKKSFGIVLFLCFVFGTIMIYSLNNAKSSDRIGVLFILGSPIIIMIIAFFYTLIKKPIQYELTKSEIVMTYFNHKIVNVNIIDINYVALKIHSQKTALISIYYQDCMNIDKTRTINIYKNRACKNIEEVYKTFCSKVTKDCSTIVLATDDLLGKKCHEILGEFDWYEFMTKKKTLHDTFNEIIDEGIIKKSLLVLGFIFLVLIKASAHDKSFIIDSSICWLIGILLSIYLVLSFFARKIGYARDECIQLFISFIFLVFFGGAAIMGLYEMLSKLISHII